MVIEKEYRLAFGSFIFYDNGILETILDDGIEVSGEMADEYLDLMRSIGPRLIGCLANRKNSYSFSFKASLKLAAADTVKFVAVVKYGGLPWPLKGSLSPKFYRMRFLIIMMMVWLGCRIKWPVTRKVVLERGGKLLFSHQPKTNISASKIQREKPAVG